jgi:electron transfer flavoprotein alpha subunit
MNETDTHNPHGLYRRDPRQEWIQRNRLHPLHGQVIHPKLTEQRGPSGLIRKNPHQVGFIGPHGIKRIDRMAGNSSQPLSLRRAPVTTDIPLPLINIVDPAFYIAVVPDFSGGYLSAHDKDILGQAQALVDEISQARNQVGAVVAIAFGDINATDLDTAGVDRLIHMCDTQVEPTASMYRQLFNGDYNPEACLSVLCAVDSQLTPLHWLLPDSTHGGFDTGCRLAAALGERPATQVYQANAKQVIGRINGSTQDYQRETPRLLMLSAECHLPVDETRHEVIELPIQPLLDSHIQDSGSSLKPQHITSLGLMNVDPNAIPLAEAPFIVSGGNGIRQWELFHQAAKALGATEGASRVAVDDGFMPRHRQVGATGTWVTADVYLAVGISGAIQHMQGIGQCRKVIAVNTDPNCDMVKRADLSFIIDSQAFLEALLNALKPINNEANEHAA